MSHLAMDDVLECSMDSHRHIPEHAAETASKPAENFRHLDVLTMLSFIVGGFFGIGSLFHRIRERFHQTFVLGYGETATPFTSIVERYNGRQGMPDPANSKSWGEFDKIAFMRKENKISPEEYAKQRGEIARNFRKEINTVLRKDYHIPTENALKDWTLGTVKRWKLLGNTSRVEVGLGFASLAAVTVGAISMLRHNKRTLDGIEDMLERRESETRSR
jgi:hypothetical protein